jgi:hypothetical protein
LGIDISNVDVGDKAIIDAGILRINEEEDIFYANVFGKKNKDEGEIENDYNDDEDCENCIRMDDANTHTHTHTDMAFDQLQLTFTVITNL